MPLTPFWSRILFSLACLFIPLILLLFFGAHTTLLLPSPPPALFDLTYPTKAQRLSQLIPQAHNPNALTIYELIHRCVHSRKQAILFEDRNQLCSLSDPALTPIQVDFIQHVDCKAVVNYLTNEFNWCSYDTSQSIPKSHIKQPLGFIIDNFGSYFDHFRVNFPDKSISMPIPSSPPPSSSSSSLLQPSSLSLPTYPSLSWLLFNSADLDRDLDVDYVYSNYLHLYSTLQLPLLQKHIHYVRSIFGLYAKSGTKSIDGIYSKSRRSTILETEPWFNVYYIRDALRAKIRINSIHDIKPILGFFLLHGYTIVQADYDKFTNPKGFWGWRPIAFDLRAPTSNDMVFDDEGYRQHFDNDVSGGQDGISSSSSSSSPPPAASTSKSFSSSTTIPPNNNSGLVIELYFVPYHMDLKETKGKNHHLYEKWRNMPLLPVFQTHLQRQHDSINWNNGYGADLSRFHHVFNRRRGNDDDEKARLAIYLAPRDLRTTVFEIKRDIDATLPPECQNHNTSDAPPNNHHCQLDHLHQKLHVDYSLDEIQALWVEYQNDIFTSSMTYLNALEQWALGNPTSDGYWWNPATNQFETRPHMTRPRVEPSSQLPSLGTITEIEHDFHAYINSNLRQCGIQCEDVWQIRSQRDILDNNPNQIPPH